MMAPIFFVLMTLSARGTMTRTGRVGRLRPESEPASSFLTESSPGARRRRTGPLTLRADSGFSNHKVVDACPDACCALSDHAKIYPVLKMVIEAVDESAWTPASSWRMWPKANERRDVLGVDGAITRNDRTAVQASFSPYSQLAPPARFERAT
jgi:hypothetical protein